jgi:hypothetical protein
MGSGSIQISGSSTRDPFPDLDGADTDAALDAVLSGVIAVAQDAVGGGPDERDLVPLGAECDADGLVVG